MELHTKMPLDPSKLARTLVISRVLEALRAFPDVLEKLNHQSFLVTGALGYFGQYVVDVLLGLNDAGLAHIECVYALDVAQLGAEPRQRWFLSPNSIVRNFQHDVRHDISTELASPRPNHIWHLAGIASPYWYERRPWDTIACAVDGLRKMVELSRLFGARLVFTSSSEVYQTAERVPTPEEYIGAVPSRTKRSCYDISKLMGETIAWLAANEGVPSVTTRIFNSFGPGMSEEDRRILPRIASALVGKRLMQVYMPAFKPLEHEWDEWAAEPVGIVAPSRTYTPVANTLLGFFLAATRGASGAVYNIGLDKPELNVVELIEKTNQLETTTRAGRFLDFEMVPPPANYETEPLRRCPDITKLRALGFAPCMELDEGLELFFQWALVTYKGIP